MAKSLEDGDFKGDLGGEMGDNLPYYAIIETPKIWKIARQRPIHPEMNVRK